MTVFLDALSDAWGQMTGTLSYVAQAFGENWRTGLAALIDSPTALFYVVRRERWKRAHSTRLARIRVMVGKRQRSSQ